MVVGLVSGTGARFARECRGGDDVFHLVVLSRMFLKHVKSIERYPALAKLVFSDHLCLAAVIDRAKSDGAVGDAATMFLNLIQGLGFQFAIARLPVRLSADAEGVLALYLQASRLAADNPAHRRIVA
jgi:hypothetical protein